MDIYRKDMLTIPRPEFIVLYNGPDEVKDEVILNLSDMFARQDKQSPRRPVNNTEIIKASII